MPRKKQKSGPGPRPSGPPARTGPASAPSSSQAKIKGSKKTSNPTAGEGGGDGRQKKQSLQMNQRPIVPFLRGDRILLVGEGDFSFARSLAKQYKCRKLCATCYDSKETLFKKYPQAEGHIQEILDSFKPKAKAKIDSETAVSNPNSNAEDHHTSPESNSPSKQPSSPSSTSSSKPTPKVLFSVDARKLGSPAGGGKEIRSGFPRKEPKIPAWKLHQQSQSQSQSHSKSTQSTSSTSPSGPWDVICFNFPHVGGLSTDVNRQVRANQELLVAFFKACVPLLSAAPRPVDEDHDEWEADDSDSDEESEDGDDDPQSDEEQTSGKAVRTGPGQILVSLFEGEPYTLWNIKDLARHAGLQVVTSFKFPWTEYEGYSHARTLGEVEGKDGGRGGWRGEDRLARMYVFEVKREESSGQKKGKEKENKQKQKNKRARDEDSDSE